MAIEFSIHFQSPPDAHTLVASLLPQVLRPVILPRAVRWDVPGAFVSALVLSENRSKHLNEEYGISVDQDVHLRIDKFTFYQTGVALVFDLATEVLRATIGDVVIEDGDRLIMMRRRGDKPVFMSSDHWTCDRRAQLERADARA